MSSLKPATHYLAAAIDRKLYAEYMAYVEASEADLRKGLRPHYCEHGTDLWTDYDPICGPCEEGLSLGNSLFRMRLAIDEAKARIEAVERIEQAIDTFRANSIPVDSIRCNSRIHELLTI